MTESFDAIKERLSNKWTPEPFSGCWLWTGTVTSNGYAKIHFSNPRRSESAHRVSWELYRYAIPKGLNVLHRCDVRCCVNPAHLFLGTMVDNAQDCIRKGRFRCRKLTSVDLEVIRASKGLLTSIELGAQLKVHSSTICRVWLHQTYKT